MVKRYFPFFVLLAALVYPVSGQNVNNFAYTVDNGRVSITNYWGDATDVIVPERLNGLPVVEIWERAFDNIPLTSIILPDTLTHIGDWAFYGNTLARIVLPDNVDIQVSSFPYLSVYYAYIGNERKRSTFIISVLIVNDFEIAVLNNSAVEIINYKGNAQDVIIPERIYDLPVIAIGNSAFSGRQLNSITLPESLEYIGHSAFSANRLVSLALPASITQIGKHAFDANELAIVALSDSLTCIEDGAFSRNRLTNVVLPDSITQIGFLAFHDNPLTSIAIPGDAEIHIFSFPYLSVYDLYIREGKKKTTFTVSLTTYENFKIAVVNNSVVEIRGLIGGFTGPGTKNIDLIIPERIYDLPVIAIGEYAFAFSGRRIQLTSVTLPNTITYIGARAFSHNLLSSITLPDAIVHIEHLAFADNKLGSVTLPNSLKYIGHSAFSENHLTSVTFPDSMTHIPHYLFMSNRLGSIIIPDTITHIGEGAFEYNQLSSVTLPDSVTHIGLGAFRGNKLTDITLPGSVTHIEAWTFEKNLLTKVVIPQSVISLSSDGFDENVEIVRR